MSGERLCAWAVAALGVAMGLVAFITSNPWLAIPALYCIPPLLLGAGSKPTSNEENQ